MRTPTPDRPIEIAAHRQRVRVIVGGIAIAETTRALVLREAGCPAVLYIPREDADWKYLARNPRSTHCPHKGDASYYDLTLHGATRSAAVWSYEAPYPAVAAIKDRLAFYPGQVDAIEEAPSDGCQTPSKSYRRPDSRP